MMLQRYCVNKKARTGHFGKVDEAEKGDKVGWNLKNTESETKLEQAQEGFQSNPLHLRTEKNLHFRHVN